MLSRWSPLFNFFNLKRKESQSTLPKNKLLLEKKSFRVVWFVQRCLTIFSNLNFIQQWKKICFRELFVNPISNFDDTLKKRKWAEFAIFLQQLQFFVCFPGWLQIPALVVRQQPPNLPINQRVTIGVLIKWIWGSVPIYLRMVRN